MQSIQNGEYSVGLDGTSKKFSKPWTQTLMMFLGEALCLLLFVWEERKRKKRFVGLEGELLPDSDYRLAIPQSLLPEEVAKGRSVNPLLFAIPSCMDLLGTSLAGIGLLYVLPSVWQMLRGSIIIFSAIGSAIFLKQKRHAFHWIGILITFCGLAIVGAAALLDAARVGDKKEKSKVGLGILLIICGQICAAAQMIIEEKLLKQRQVPALKVVGMEGVWGSAIMACAVLPAMYFIRVHGERYEDAADAAVMMKNNPGLMTFCVLYLVSIAFYNYAGLSVAKSLTSVHRTLIDALRTVSVWGGSLVINHFTHGRFCEGWGHYSWMQIIGFLFLIVGTLVYNKVLRLPCLVYEDAPKKPTEEIILREGLLLNSDKSEHKEGKPY